MKTLIPQEPNRLVLDKCKVPKPVPGEVLIRIVAASICHTDFVAIHGQLDGCKYPTVLGHEFSGIVEECGEGVTNVAKGDGVTSLTRKLPGNWS